MTRVSAPLVTMSTPYWDHLRIIHALLQIAALAPFNVQPTIEETKLSKSLAIYNICVSILVLANVIYSETDPRNSGNYINKTPVVDTAFDAVDWFGNFYVAISSILSIIQYKNTCRVHFGIQRLFKNCDEMGIQVDTKLARNYFIFKMIIASIGTITVMILYILFDNEANFTVTYWICVLIPMAIAAIVTMVFGTATLVLYQNLWILNESLKRMMDQYIGRLNDNKPKSILFNYEKSLETLILKNNFFKPVTRPKPFIVFISNYPECFEKSYLNILKELNNLREFYNKIIEAGSLINKLFGPHLLFLFSWYFLGAVINIYSTVTFHATGEFKKEYGARVILTISYVFMVVYIVWYTSFITGEVI